jgi:hypothetical protein
MDSIDERKNGYNPFATGANKMETKVDLRIQILSQPCCEGMPY